MSNPVITVQTKQTLAVAMRWWPLRRLLGVAVKLFAPSHRIGVGVVLWDDHGRVLLLHHVFHPTMPWGLPGGWLDKGEDPLAGAVRELREETGIDTAVFGPLIHLRRDHPPDHIGMAYIAHLLPPTPPTLKLSHEITQAAWFHPHQLPQPFSQFAQEAIHLAAQHRQNMRDEG
jgi:8-oxo-dGTP pyrophosphatase MutT (NUDIX family)